MKYAASEGLEEPDRGRAPQVGQEGHLMQNSASASASAGEIKSSVMRRSRQLTMCFGSAVKGMGAGTHGMLGLNDGAVGFYPCSVAKRKQ